MKCEYADCGKEFDPNPRNRTKNTQRFCSYLCRWRAWNEANPRQKLPPNSTPIETQTHRRKHA